jgi:hypothetical protein
VEFTPLNGAHTKRAKNNVEAHLF